MKTVKRIWKWLSGKKSAIGIVGLSFCQLGLIKNNINPGVLEILNLLFTIMGGAGVIHRDWKSDNSVLKRVNKSINQSVQKYKKNN